MTFSVELEQENDGRWIAEVTDLPGVLAYGASENEAKARVQALALRVLADRLEHGEASPEFTSITFAAA
ncbi:MAG: type II toxin-antitoxin system HicB family antitoxin [Candidatus Saccharimonas sp.]|nr:type II toxin-antitoxin system HicB family antitoxin [Planctomycetaceae bacterium]